MTRNMTAHKRTNGREDELHLACGAHTNERTAWFRFEAHMVEWVARHWNDNARPCKRCWPKGPPPTANNTTEV
jgi:methylphosphotriester-DNA--protein-cysteine methyltransferase